MKELICFDIDGVVRDFDSALRLRLGKKDYTYEEGAVLFDMVKEDASFLSTLRETKYCSIIRKYFDKPIFISYQPLDWREQTIKWLNQHFRGGHYIIFTKSAKEKVKYYKQFKYVVEDYPYFPEYLYPNIILIDTCYNKQVDNSFNRIKTKRQLEETFKGIKIHEYLFHQ